MKKNSGMTIVEILISICIIAIVLALLFNMLIQVRNEDVSNTIQSNFLMNQSLFIKEIEEDIINYGIKSVSSCNLSEANITTDLLNAEYQSKFKCIKFEYTADYTEDNIGFLTIYNTYTEYEKEGSKYIGKENSAKWMIQYVRGSYKKYLSVSNTPDYSSWKNATQDMKELPSEVDLSDNPYLLYTAADGNTINAGALVVPIVNAEGEHYDINLSFTFNGNNTFKCISKKESLLSCRCSSDPALCQKTYN